MQKSKKKSGAFPQTPASAQSAGRHPICALPGEHCSLENTGSESTNTISATGTYSNTFMYSKKVADEYPLTQAVPDDPHNVSPLIPQMMPKVPSQNSPHTSYLMPPKGFFKFGNYVL